MSNNGGNPNSFGTFLQTTAPDSHKGEWAPPVGDGSNSFGAQMVGSRIEDLMDEFGVDTVVNGFITAIDMLLNYSANPEQWKHLNAVRDGCYKSLGPSSE